MAGLDSLRWLVRTLGVPAEPGLDQIGIELTWIHEERLEDQPSRLTRPEARIRKA